MEKSRFRPLGGATLKQKLRIRKERPRFSIDMCCPFYAIFFGSRVINVFRLTWEIPISGQNFWVFPTLWPQKWLRNILTPKRHILAWKHAFWRIDRPNRSKIATCRRAEQSRKKKLKKTKKKVRNCGYISPCAMVLPLRGRTMAFGIVVVLA